MDVVNGDLSQRVAIATADLPWIQRGNVHEKLLEQMPGRRTALVHVPTGAQLPVFAGGAIDVLIFAGELGGHGARTYLHEPAGERALIAGEPTTAFVKQRPSRAPARIAIDTRSVAYHRQLNGLMRAILHADDDGNVVLLGFDAGSTVGTHDHEAGEEFLVLSGSVVDEAGTYQMHDWVRQPHGSTHSISSPEGCLFFTFAHHL